MAQEAPAPAEGEKPAAEAPKDDANTQTPESAESPKTFDADYVKSLREENAKRRIEAQQLTERLEELEERDKSELERAVSKVSKAEKRAADAEGNLLRFQIAAEKQVPKELIQRLQGNTREELEADADELLSLVKSRTDNENTPDFDGGAREPAPELDPETGFNKTALQVLGLSQK
jgi:hypothetical protein